MRLMQDMVAAGELEHLVPERVWAEIEGAMATKRPGVFIDVLRRCGALCVLLPEVDRLYGIPQPEKYHPEIDTGRHVQLTMDTAARLGGSSRVVFALLLHDLGKGLTPAAELPSHVGHENSGLPLVEAVCERLRAPNAYRRLALKVCELHLRCHRLMEARPVAVMKLLEDADLLRRAGEADEFSLACKADYLGRKGLEHRPYPQAERLKAALSAALSIRARDMATQGMRGAEIGRKLREARIRAIADIADPPG